MPVMSIVTCSGVTRRVEATRKVATLERPYSGFLSGPLDGFVTRIDMNAFLCGDCELDQDVDVVDALLAAQFGAQLSPQPTGIQLRACDVNGDTQAEVIDALLIARFDAQLVATLSCAP